METLWTLYHPEIPLFLEKFSCMSSVMRLRDVGMNCGCEYTAFPRFAEIGPYSRYEHSLGVALIVWHFTGRQDQALAGLFHDLATPVFAHVVDFLNGDHLHQESTEAGTRECIAGSPELMKGLGELGLTVDQVADYHQYPIADNAAPALSADRLEYTLGNLLNYGFADQETVSAFYRDLTVGTDEHGREELVFQTPEIAEAFASAALQNSRVYVADEDRLAMQMLADLLQTALQRGILRREDLWQTEPRVIRRLETDAVCGEAWRRFCGSCRVVRSDMPLPDGHVWRQVDAKKRWVDPLVPGMGRVSQWSGALREQMASFQALDFSVWLRAETKKRALGEDS